jgi:hypothetical protein
MAEDTSRDHLPAFCCDEFRSAYDVTFVNPVGGTVGWILYGTDYETVSVGQPELRYWPIHHCPFCGVKLPPITESSRPDALPRRPPKRTGG